MPIRREISKGSPHVNHIIRTLEERIRTGRYAAGRWLPPERSLCAEFDVSRATLRLALVQLEQRQLLLRAAGCRPLVRAMDRAVVHQHNSVRRNIGLCVKHDPKYSGTSLLTQGVQRAVDSDAYRLITATVAADSLSFLAEAEAQALSRLIRDEDISGIIVWYSGLPENLAVLQAARAAQIPLIFVDRAPPEGFEADFVGIDNERAACDAVQHLLLCGHRTIAHVSNPDPVSTVSEREAGYRNALRAAGISLRDELVLMGRLEGMTGAGGLDASEIVERLLSLSQPPTAIFAVTDYIALALITALEERGLRVPEDMAIAGFDDLEQWLPQEPFLTTVRQPFARLGAEAVRLLFKRLEAGQTHTYRHLLLDAGLIVRGSTQGGVHRRSHAELSPVERLPDEEAADRCSASGGGS